MFISCQKRFEREVKVDGFGRIERQALLDGFGWIKR
jgi:hypothetical protein